MTRDHRSSLEFLVSAVLAVGVIVNDASAQTGAPGPAPAQIPSSVAIARRFAPILWFASDEPFWPTLPYPFLFDGVNNNKAPTKDLGDVTEIEFGMPAEDQVRSMRELGALTCAERPPMVVLFDGPRPAGRFGGRSMYVIEYWMYFLHDNGVNGHGGDSEHVFVFIEDGNENLPFDHPGRFTTVKAIVGAGHTSYTPSNILVTVGEFGPRDVVDPKFIHTHTPVLIELGKHATAPDRNMNGRFDRGVDANIFRDAAWGTRDVHTGSVGKLLSRYRDWYSFSRVPSRLAFEEEANLDDGEYATLLRDLTDVAVCAPGQDCLTRAFAGNLRYRLVPLETWKALVDALRDDEHGKSKRLLTERSPELWGRQRTALGGTPEQGCRTTTAPLANWSAPRVEHEVPPALWQSLRASVLASADEHHLKILKHPDRVSTDAVFKLYLFPRVSVGGSYNWSGTVDGSTSRVSVWFSESRLSWLPKLGKAPHLNNSAVEAFCAVDRKVFRNRPEYCGGNYEFFRGELTGFYTGMLFSLSPGQAAFKERVGAEGGLALAWYTRARTFADGKIGIRFEPWRVREAGSRWSVHASLGLRVGVVKPKHPLSY